jgi:hypothetical protein
VKVDTIGQVSGDVPSTVPVDRLQLVQAINATAALLQLLHGMLGVPAADEGQVTP